MNEQTQNKALDNAKEAVMLTVKSFLALPRRLRRSMFRRYLKAHQVPNPIFPLVSAKREFKRLNYITFLQDLHESTIKKAVANEELSK